MLDQEVVLLDNFKGLYKRGDTYVIPPGYCKEFTNLVVRDGSIKARGGTTFFANQPGQWTNILRIWVADAAGSLFVLSGTSVYYSPFGVTPIITGLPANSDINILKVFGRFYITIHDRSMGIFSHYYVFDPVIMTVARDALGNGAPSSATVANGAAGTKNVSAGIHIWAVTFETNSGHICGMGNNAVVSFTHNGTTKANLTGIPLGPAGTVARQILVTKVIPNFDGNLFNYQLFFVPTVGRIGDNVTTVLTGVEFYDSELLDDGDYLKDILGGMFIPLGMCLYSNRVITWGEQDLGGAAVGPHVFRASEIGKPETFSASEGFQEVNKDFGSGIQLCLEYKGLLVIMKDNGTFVTKDNGGSPNTWEIVRVSNLIGSYVYGVCRLADTQPGSISDNLLIFNRTGLHIFDGQYRDIPLNINIDSLWEDTVKSLSNTDLKKCQIFADHNGRKIYISFPITTTQFPKMLLVCDYRNGLSPEAIKWYKFVFYSNGTANMEIRSIHSAYDLYGILVAKFDTVFKLDELYASSIGVDSDDAAGTRFNWNLETGELPESQDINVDQYTGIKVLAKNFSNAPDDGINLQLGTDPVQVWTLPNTETINNFNTSLTANRPTLKLNNNIGSYPSYSPDAGGYPEYIKAIAVYGKLRSRRSPI